MWKLQQAENAAKSVLYPFILDGLCDMAYEKTGTPEFTAYVTQNMGNPAIYAIGTSYEPEGVLLYTIPEDKSAIAVLFVHVRASSTRKGLMTAMFREIELIAVRHGIPEVLLLGVLPNNSVALKAFSKVGMAISEVHMSKVIDTGR